MGMGVGDVVDSFIDVGYRFLFQVIYMYVIHGQLCTRIFVVTKNVLTYITNIRLQVQLLHGVVINT